MIYYMNTKTLVTQYAEEFGPEHVLATNFLVLANNITGNFRTEEKINRLQWNNTVLFGLAEKQDQNIAVVMKKMMTEINDLALLIKTVRLTLVDPDSLHVILSTPKAEKTRYPQALVGAIEEMFGYPVIDYKHRERTYEVDETKVAQSLNYWVAVYNRNVMRFDPDNLKQYGKKRKKKLLKTLGLYEKGMDTEEMDTIIMDDADLVLFQGMDRLWT